MMGVVVKFSFSLLTSRDSFSLGSGTKNALSSYEGFPQLDMTVPENARNTTLVVRAKWHVFDLDIKICRFKI